MKVNKSLSPFQNLICFAEILFAFSPGLNLSLDLETNILGICLVTETQRIIVSVPSMRLKDS